MFNPQVLYCYGKPLCTIPRDSTYYGYQGRSVCETQKQQSTYMWFHDNFTLNLGGTLLSYLIHSDYHSLMASMHVQCLSAVLILMLIFLSLSLSLSLLPDMSTVLSVSVRSPLTRWRLVMTPSQPLSSQRTSSRRWRMTRLTGSRWLPASTVPDACTPYVCCTWTRSTMKGSSVMAASRKRDRLGRRTGSPQKVSNECVCVCVCVCVCEWSSLQSS